MRQDLAHVGTLACLLAWRAGVRERRRAAAAATALAPALAPFGGGEGPGSEDDGEEQGGGGGAAAAAPGVSRGVQTEHGLSMAGVTELVAAFRALADSSNPSTRLCESSLNLLDHFLGREGWGQQEGDGGGAGGDGFGEAEGVAEEGEGL